jgi:hypothetical protein
MINDSALPAAALILVAALFLTVCALLVWLAAKKRYLLLLLWPAFIYFTGPMLTVFFVDAPVLGRYVFPSNVIAETLMMFVYVVAFCLLDMAFDISDAIRRAFSSATMRNLSASPVFLILYLPTTVVAVVLQIKMLHDSGSVFSGSYVLNDIEFGLIPYWGFLSGLYEIIFLLFVVFLLGTQKGWPRFVVIALYVLTALLRVAGGTRLILIKEIAVLLIIFYMNGQIRARRLVIAAAVALALGSVVGLARSSGGNASLTALGPLYGLVMESGLNALTFNVAYAVQQGGYISHHSQLLDAIQYMLLNAAPTFLRPGISQMQLDSLSPYGQALGFGFDTYTPVGGLSGFAVLCYLTSYPLFLTVVLVGILALYFKFAPNGPFKYIVICVFSINAIHFWRDPAEIAIKLIVQDLITSLALLYFYIPRRRRPVARNFSVPMESAPR